MKASDLLGETDGPLDEFKQLPREELIQHSLAKPESPGALKVGSINNITKARIRYSLSQLIALEIPNMQQALLDLRKESPKAYLEQVMELATFSLPKLKAVAIDVSDNRESNARQLTLDELQSALVDDTVVSQQ
jgi:hypothetical protein